MRPADLARLSSPFEPDADRDAVTAQALGVHTPHWRALESAILSDLMPMSPYGLSWLQPASGTKLRILVSDYMFCCASSVGEHLREAALHWLELLERVDRNAERFSDSVVIVHGEVVPRTRPPATPAEHLTTEFVSLHRIGLVRALASALDCVAGVVVGAVAVPDSIAKASWPRLRRWFKDLKPKDGDVVGLVQQEFGETLEKAITECGPAGWLDWVLDYRNMVVHRGRRIETGMYEPTRIPRLDAAGEIQPVIAPLMSLPRDPARSDVEVMLDEGQPSAPVLTEVAEMTVLGALASTRQLVDWLGVLVSDFVEWRRQNPGQLIQPPQQWPNGPSDAKADFQGYHPGSLNFDPTIMVSGPVVLQRLRSAALDDSARPSWATFD
jgi:hypothetical protein